LAAQTIAVATGAHVVPRLSRITVQAFYDDWSRRQVWASGTRTAMDLAMRSSGLGGYQLGQVSHSQIEAWIKRMADQPIAPGTIKTRYNNVRGVFRAAVRDRLIARDPTEAVRLPRQRRADASMTIPSIEDVGALVTAADDSFRAFVALCAFAGLRLGEAAADQVADIDFLRRQLTVARQVQRAGERQVEIKAPKYGSERVIYLPDERQRCSLSTSRSTPSGVRPTAGSSRASRVTRRTRTPSATGGARPRRPPESPASGCTTCATSTPPASSRPAATSSPCSARWVTRRRQRRCGPTPTSGRRPRIAPAPLPPI
jgi:integrase